MKPSAIAFLAIIVMPVIAYAGAPRCDPAGPSYQTCKVNPDVTEKYTIAAKAYGTALKDGVHWMDVTIKVNDKECAKNRTKAWQDGPGEIQTSCELKLEKDKEHNIEGVSDNGNVAATKFELTVKRSSE